MRGGIRNDWKKTTLAAQTKALGKQTETYYQYLKKLLARKIGRDSLYHRRSTRLQVQILSTKKRLIFSMPWNELYLQDDLYRKLQMVNIS